MKKTAIKRLYVRNSVANQKVKQQQQYHLGYIRKMWETKDSVKKNIIKGKYVNLATFLIPEYELLKEPKATKDPRLAKSFH